MMFEIARIEGPESMLVHMVKKAGGYIFGDLESAFYVVMACVKHSGAWVEVTKNGYCFVFTHPDADPLRVWIEAKHIEDTQTITIQHDSAIAGFSTFPDKLRMLYAIADVRPLASWRAYFNEAAKQAETALGRPLTVRERRLMRSIWHGVFRGAVGAPSVEMLSRNLIGAINETV